MGAQRVRRRVRSNRYSDGKGPFKNTPIHMSVRSALTTVAPVSSTGTSTLSSSALVRPRSQATPCEAIMGAGASVDEVKSNPEAQGALVLCKRVAVPGSGIGSDRVEGV